MKHLRLFEAFEDIDSICKELGIRNYTINSDGTVDVYGSINLSLRGLTKLPLKFGKIDGWFDCSGNQLTTLEGSPIEVTSSFICSDNQLVTLEGSPKEVGRDFDCGNNQLTTLEGGPKEVGGDFVCSNNQLTTLKGGPIEVTGDYNCDNNKLITLEGSPSEIYKHMSFNCFVNPIHSIYHLFPDYKSFMNSLDYNYLRGTNIVKTRFEEACEEAGIKIPKKIEGYNWI